MSEITMDFGIITACRQRLYQAFESLGIDADVVGYDADLSKYKIVVAPMMYICKEGFGNELKKYVENGGCLIATYMSSYVNESLLCYLGGFPGDGLSELFGVRASEIDSLYPQDRNQIIWNEKKYEVKDFCELVELEGGKPLAKYEMDFYKGKPAVIENSLGKGRTYYVACRTEMEFLKDFLVEICKMADIRIMENLPQGTSYHVRTDGNCEYHFFLNYTNEEKRIGTHLLPAVSGIMIKEE